MMLLGQFQQALIQELNGLTVLVLLGTKANVVHAGHSVLQEHYQTDSVLLQREL